MDMNAFCSKSDSELVKMVEVGKFNRGGFENVALVQEQDGEIHVEIDLSHSVHSDVKKRAKYYLMIGGSCKTPEQILQRITDYRERPESIIT